MINQCSNLFLILFIFSVLNTVIGMTLVVTLNDDDKIYGGYIVSLGIVLLIFISNIKFDLILY